METTHGYSGLQSEQPSNIIQFPLPKLPDTDEPVRSSRFHGGIGPLLPAAFHYVLPGILLSISAGILGGLGHNVLATFLPALTSGSLAFGLTLGCQIFLAVTAVSLALTGASRARALWSATARAVIES